LLVAPTLAGISIAFAMPRTRWRWLVLPLMAFLFLVVDLYLVNAFDTGRCTD
jgi:hypothetical protein